MPTLPTTPAAPPPAASSLAPAPLAVTRAACLRARCIESPLLRAAADANGASRLLPVAGSTKRVRVRDKGEWPTSTPLWCWYCCHPFPGAPLPMPIKYDDRQDVFHVTGTFCSWACMKAFNWESSSYLKSVNANLITLFHRRCTGTLRHIRPAPPKQALAVFGGTMSIEEFRRAPENPVEYAVLPPRMIVHHHAIQETRLSVADDTGRAEKKQNLDTVVCFKDVPTKNETLRLKRPKPLQHNRNLLERTMGINALGALVK